MPRIAYIDRTFSPGSLEIIDRANEFIADYTRQGFNLTLRQLYYQFVAHDLIENKDSEYKRLGSVINDARLAGRIDWNAIQDRTRFLRDYAWNEDPEELIQGIGEMFTKDYWSTQSHRIEVWVEKDALIDVVGRACQAFAVPFFSCRGYTSQTEMWVAGRRLRQHALNGQQAVVLHLGDHDPSGIDMSRDIEERLTLFMDGEPLEFHRLALNMDQVDDYSPPPNPAKITDSRAASYIRDHGNESWELDALEPQVLVDLIQASIRPFIDQTAWQATLDEIEEGRGLMRKLEERWPDVATFLEELS